MKRGFRKALLSLGRTFHVVAERELTTQNCEWKKKKNIVIFDQYLRLLKCDKF